MPDYALMNQLLYEGDAPKVKEMVEKALADGAPVEEILGDGLIAGMRVHNSGRTDEYLDYWHWSDPKEQPRAAVEVAESLERELEAQLRLK